MLANGKALDTQGLVAKMLKWGGEKTKTIITRLINMALEEGLPPKWQLSRIVLLHKGGDSKLA